MGRSGKILFHGLLQCCVIEMFAIYFDLGGTFSPVPDLPVFIRAVFSAFFAALVAPSSRVLNDGKEYESLPPYKAQYEGTGGLPMVP